MRKYLLLALLLSQTAMAQEPIKPISSMQFCTNWIELGPVKNSTCTPSEKGVSIGFAAGSTKEDLIAICGIFKAGRTNKNMSLMAPGSIIKLNYLVYNDKGIHGLSVVCKP